MEDDDSCQCHNACTLSSLVRALLALAPIVQEIGKFILLPCNITRMVGNCMQLLLGTVALGKNELRVFMLVIAGIMLYNLVNRFRLACSVLFTF
jgi:hypothetical protein